jgi:hypothetical protein
LERSTELLVGAIDAARGSGIASNTLHAARGGKTGEQGHRQGRLGAGGAQPFMQGGGSLVMAQSRSALVVDRGRGVEVDIGALARGVQMAPRRWRDRRWWAAPDTDTEAQRRRLSALKLASGRLGWAWQSDALGMERAVPVA